MTSSAPFWVCSFLRVSPHLAVNLLENCGSDVGLVRFLIGFRCRGRRWGSHRKRSASRPLTCARTLNTSPSVCSTAQLCASLLDTNRVRRWSGVEPQPANPGHPQRELCILVTSGLSSWVRPPSRPGCPRSCVRPREWS